MKKTLLLLALTLCTAVGCRGSLVGDAIVIEDRKLTDEEFYNIVSCGAAPGEGCRKPRRKWWKDEVTVKVAPAQEGFHYNHIVIDKTEEAIQQINQVGVIKLKLVDRPVADITITGVSAKTGEKISGTKCSRHDGSTIGWARFGYFFRNNVINKACISISASVPPYHLQRVVAEELIQSLGLLYDIQTPYYRKISVFSQKGRLADRYSPQDLEALRRHYD